MDFMLPCPILNVEPSAIEVVRKEYNLDGPGRMEEAINILQDWIRQQPHFKKKDFSSYYIESAIIATKGSIERAKTQLDKLCTIRTMTPQFFAKYNVKEFEEIYDLVCLLNMPNATDDLYRVHVIKMYTPIITPEQYLNLFRHGMILAEYMKVHDYFQRYKAIIDIRGINLVDLLKYINPMDMKHILSVIIGGFGFRVKNIFLLSESKTVDLVVSTFKQILSKKLGERIQVLRTNEELHKMIPRKILPLEFGGEEKSIKEIMKDFVKVLTSEEKIKYFKEMSQAGTDENCRLEKNKYNDENVEMYGTFRKLNVD